MGICGSSSKTEVETNKDVQTAPPMNVVEHPMDADSSPPESPLHSKWEAGYLLDDNPGGSVNTYEDYRGFEVTTTNSVSKTKTDNICRWADTALECRAQYGNIFFNPQNPKQWPREVIDTYDPNAFYTPLR